MAKDSMTRQINALHVLGATTVTFQNPDRALIPNEWFTITGQNTEYNVQTSSTGTCTISPALSAQVADNTELTRFDKYAPMDFYNLLDELGMSDEDKDEDLTFIYKKSLACRFKLEKILPSLKTKSYTEWFDVEYTGKDFIFLNHYPIVSITSVAIGNGLTTLQSTDYEYDSDTGRMHKYGGWSCGVREVKVVYTAGQDVIDPDIGDIYSKYVRYHYEFGKVGKDRPYFISESSAGGTIELSSPADIDEWLDRQLSFYRSIRV